MYARKLRNRSGSTSVQVIRKEKGRYRVVKTFGTSHEPDEIARLWIQVERYARDPDPDQSHLFELYSERVRMPSIEKKDCGGYDRGSRGVD